MGAKRMKKGFILILLSFALILNILLFLNSNYFKFKFQDKEIEEVCNDDSFLKYSRCLNSYVKANFKYDTESNPSNFNELKINGGDCNDYSKFYAYYLEKVGYDYEYVDTSYITGLRENYGEDPNTIYLGDKFERIGHVFTVGYGDYSYCILDMKNINCRRLRL
jgi:hypothetical protein